MKIYKIGDKEFYQDKLKLGQIRQLLPYFDKIVNIFDENLSLIDFVAKLSDDISDILAIILIEKGTKLKDKNVEELAGFLDENLDLDTTLEVISDFFAITPIGSLLERIGSMLGVKSQNLKKNG